MSRATFLAKLARWSYFLLALTMLMGSFVHLNIKFNAETCRNNDSAITLNYSCIGRNLIWLLQKPLSIDSNINTWRTVFNLTPDIFVDIWCPLFLSTLAFLQHFQGSKWDVVSGSWFRACCFIMFWMLFGAFGYAANWGAFIGFIGICWVDVLYFILIFISVDDEVPVLQLDIRPVGVSGAQGGRPSIHQQDPQQQQQQQRQDDLNNPRYGPNDAILTSDNAHAMNMNETLNPNDSTNATDNDNNF